MPAHTANGGVRLNFHHQRDRLLAETHARPPTPFDAPMLIARIASLSSETGAADDRAHMARLCRALSIQEPSPTARWWALDAGDWRLRWERHNEFSSWTAFRAPRTGSPHESAFDGVPSGWLEELPGEVLVSTKLTVSTSATTAPPLDRDAIGTLLLAGAAELHTDLRPDAGGATRLHLIMHAQDRALAGRIALILLEIETYRLMALLAFPVAAEAAEQVRQLEAEAGALAARLADDLGVADDRALLSSLVALSGRAEALSARTGFRFAAAGAYHRIVGSRIAALRETPVHGMQTIGEFMERRLAPAMRTCDTIAGRQRDVIDRIARAGQMLNTRIEVAAEVNSVNLLRSMDQRALAQLRLQRTVEGLSVVAISYYALSLLSYPAKALERLTGLDAAVLDGALAPVVLATVWLALRRLRRHDPDDPAG